MRFTETFSLRKSLRWGGSFPNLPAASHFSIEDCVVKTEKLCEKKKGKSTENSVRKFQRPSGWIWGDAILFVSMVVDYAF